MANALHTAGPTPIVGGFFDGDNVLFIQRKITEELSRQFKQKILFDRGGVVRLMQRVAEERLESVPRMNQRVIMYAVNDFTTHQIEANKVMKWGEGLISSKSQFDTVGKKTVPDLKSMKFSNRLGVPHVGGTVRFHFP